MFKPYQQNQPNLIPARSVTPTLLAGLFIFDRQFVTNLLPASAQPKIDNTNSGGNGVTVTNVSGVEIRGLNLAGTANAIHISTFGVNAGSAIIQDNTIRTTGTEGIKVQNSSTGALSVDVQNNSINAAGNGFDAQKTSSGALTILFSNNTVKSGATAVVINNTITGNLTITGFKNNVVDQSTAGSGIVITSATFDSVPGGAYQTIDGGNTGIGVSGDGVGSSGMVLTYVKGDISFTDLDIFAEAGAGLQVTSSDPFNATTPAGFRLTVTSGVGSLNAGSGPALDVYSATLDLQLASLVTNNSATTGVSLGYVSGVFSAETGSISYANGTAFNVTGGNANITFPGMITNSVGKSVSVTLHNGGTVAFSEAITDNGGGIFLNSITGATINFSGGLSLSTGANPAFTATAGGTVNVTGSTNTLTTTTGTALNISNTTIGASGLTFERISANGAANGIVLNGTGSSSGLRVTGTGSAGSGGTLQNLTSDCVSLTNTASVEFNDTNILTCGGMGINATSVNGFIFKDGQVDQAGNFNGEHGMGFNGLTGSVLIQDTTISNIFESGILLTNATGALNMILRRTTISTNNATYGEDGFQFRLSSSATAKLLVDGSTFTGLYRDGIDGIAENASALDLTISGTNKFTSNKSNGGISLSSNHTAAVRLDMTGNTFQNNADTPVTLASMGNSTFDGAVKNNAISNPNISPTGGYGIRLAQEDDSRMIVEVNGNTVNNTFLHGFDARARLSTATGALDLTMRNNSISAPLSTDYGAYLAAGLSGSTSNNKICLDVGYAGNLGGNSITGSSGIPGVYLAQYTVSAFQIEGWNTTAQPTVASHIQTYNTISQAASLGTFTAVAAGTCATPAAVTLPAEVVSLTGSGPTLAGFSSPPTSSFSDAQSASTNVTATTETVNVNIGTLPAGKSVTITFDVKIATSLPEDMLKVSNQASATSSSFAGEVLSDDPATLVNPDPTESILYRAPIAHDDTYSTPEEISIVVLPAGVLSNDTTATGYQTQLSAIKMSDPASGDLTFLSDGSFTFVPAADFNGVASFTYRADDTQSGSNIATVGITVTPINDAPVLDASGSFSLLPIAQHEVYNSGTLVSAIIASAGANPITDVDSGAAEGIAVTSVNNTHGKWQYSTDNGSVWQDFGAPSDSSARLLAADAYTRVRFVPDQSWNGVIDPGPGFHAWDQSSGVNGGTLDIHNVEAQTAFSTAAATASITISPSVDLSLSMTSPGNPVLAGSRLDYTLTVTNAGPAGATSVAITNTLPDGLTFDTLPSLCSVLNRTATCNVPSLQAGASVNLAMSALVGTGAHGTLIDTASVTAAQADVAPDNNAVLSTIEVVPAMPVYSLGDLPGAEWNRPVMATSPNGARFLGEFGNESVTLLLERLPPHTQAIVTFNLHIIRTWDGNQVNWPGNIEGFPTLSINSIVGPDKWRLDADGTNLLNTTFANWTLLGFNQSYPQNYPGGSHPALTGAAVVNNLGYIVNGDIALDSTYRMSYTIDHQTPSLKLDFTGSGLQSLADESWGLDNVQVVLTAGADLMPYKLYFPVVGR